MNFDLKRFEKQNMTKEDLDLFYHHVFITIDCLNDFEINPFIFTCNNLIKRSLGNIGIKFRYSEKGGLSISKPWEESFEEYSKRVNKYYALLGAQSKNATKFAKENSDGSYKDFSTFYIHYIKTNPIQNYPERM